MVKYSTVADVLLSRATSHPEKIAYTFLADGENKSNAITYKDLDLQAKAIATALQEKLNPGDRALLVYPYTAGIEFIAAFMGCLYAGVIAVTDSPRRHIKALSQYQARINSSGCKIVLTTQDFVDHIKNQLKNNLSLAPQLKILPWIASDRVDIARASNWQQPDINSDTLAFFQHTSGSTGVPKGVMVSHGNILHNSETIYQAFNHHENSRILMWLPMFHDMGLIGGVIHPLYTGLPGMLMSPIALAQNPFMWLQAISKYKITTSGGPNFAYDLLCQKVTAQQRDTIDLSSWELAFSGAEPVRAETLAKFAEFYEPCGFRKEIFYPCYGMAEGTLFITGGNAKKSPKVLHVDGEALAEDRIVSVEIDTPNAKSMVSCGRAWLGDKVIIVDTETLTELPEDGVGEIWVMGRAVGQGYWGKPEETANTFQAHLADTNEGPFLRTGDLGFISNGELFITGRIKDTMILWGRNHYPQHIETNVENCHPALRPNHGAAFSIEVNGEEQLVVAHEVNRTYIRQLNVEEVVGAIRQVVGELNMASVYGVALLKTATIPKTSSGKIQRRACKQKYLDGTLDIIGQWQESQPEKTDATDLAGQFFSDR